MASLPLTAFASTAAETVCSEADDPIDSAVVRGGPTAIDATGMVPRAGCKPVACWAVSRPLHAPQEYAVWPKNMLLRHALPVEWPAAACGSSVAPLAGTDISVHMWHGCVVQQAVPCAW
jgi:hypothetical protein